jgi:hypothetical protein
VEVALQQMQLEKHPYTRGENGLFARVRQMAQQEEEEAKKRRREEHLRKAAQDSAIDTSHPHEDINMSAFKASEELNLPSTIELPMTGPMIEGSSDESIFDLELDDAQSIVNQQSKTDELPPVSKKKQSARHRRERPAWGKLEVRKDLWQEDSLDSDVQPIVGRSSTPPSSSPSLNSTKTWTNSAKAQRERVSLADIIKEAEFGKDALIPATADKKSAIHASVTSSANRTILSTSPTKAWSQNIQQPNATPPLYKPQATPPSSTQVNQWESPIPFKIASGKSQKERRRSKGASTSTSISPSKSYENSQTITSNAWQNPWQKEPSSTPTASTVKGALGEPSYFLKRENVSAVDSKASLLSASYNSSKMHVVSNDFKNSTPKLSGAGLSASWVPTPIHLPSPSIKTSPSPQVTHIHPSSTSTPTSIRQSSFLSIQQDQLQMQRAEKETTRVMKKSLGRIQMEEKAVQDISNFYRLTSAADEGEWFTLSCVPFE